MEENNIEWGGGGGVRGEIKFNINININIKQKIVSSAKPFCTLLAKIEAVPLTASTILLVSVYYNESRGRFTYVK